MQAMQYLKDKGVGFRYLYFDKLQSADKDRVRELIRSRYQGSILFPVLFLSDSRLLVGFQKEQWEKALG
jgi:glutaredoxin